MTKEQEQFEAFVTRYQDIVYSAAMRLLANSADAEDVSQEVFIRAYKRFPEFEGIQNIELWLRRVAINLSLNHITRYRRRWSFFSEFFAGGEHDNERPEIEYADCSNKTVEEIDRCRLIDELLKTLPPAQRVPLVLYHYEGLSYEEIASKLGISLSKVKTDIHRGRLELRKKITARYGEEDGLKLSVNGAENKNSGEVKDRDQSSKVDGNICMRLSRDILMSKEFLPL
ncbi:MAG: RNA polymerase sigma factor [Verrucomicrobiia bacterium]|jgi:RNA polymerase sigma-70 factor (ECF subfamily)